MPVRHRRTEEAGLDLAWLRDFEALAEAGNFSRAAEARHVTQPAFSRRIRALEAWAGTSLFDRSGQPVRLTAVGARLRPRFADIARRLDDARDEAGADTRGSLRFAATHLLSFNFFPGWLRGLALVAPSAISLVSDDLDACERLMLAGRAEFLLCHAHPLAPGRLVGPGFASRRIGRDRLHLVRAPVSSGEGRGEPPRLAYAPGSGLGRILEAAAPERRAPAFTAHHAAALRGMARDGAGVAWLPASLIAADLADGSLVAIEAAPIEVEVSLVRSLAARSEAGDALWAALPLDRDA